MFPVEFLKNIKTKVRFFINAGPLGIFLCVTYTPLAQAYSDQDIIQVNVTGNIVDGTCNITLPTNVDLGSFARQDFSVAGGNTAPVPVTLVMDSCTAGLTQATVTFTGPEYTEDPAFATAIYANQAENGATDVGLQLFNANGKELVNLADNVSYSVPIDTESNSGRFTFISRMYTPLGHPTAGPFSTSVTLNVVYN